MKIIFNIILKKLKSIKFYNILYIPHIPHNHYIACQQFLFTFRYGP